MILCFQSMGKTWSDRADFTLAQGCVYMICWLKQNNYSLKKKIINKPAQWLTPPTQTSGVRVICQSKRESLEALY